MTAKPATGALTDVRRWMRAHPYAVDALLALGALLAILLGAAAEPAGYDARPRFLQREVSVRTAVPAALACAALVLRRRAPMPVLCFTALVTVAALVVDPLGGAPAEGRRAPVVIAAIIALYTVSNRTDRVTSVRVGAATVGVLTAAGMLLGARPWYAQDNLATFAWTGLAAAAGEAVRSRRAFVDAIRERAERAERTREEEARRRVAEERMRIARELHDVVAHHIALVNVQAGVASHVMDQRPDQAKEALAHVREASRHALNELQATVGLLRQTGESPAPTEPAPGLGVLDELVDGFTRAGLVVSVDVTAEPGREGRQEGRAGEPRPGAAGYAGAGREAAAEGADAGDANADGAGPGPAAGAGARAGAVAAGAGAAAARAGAAGAGAASAGLPSAVDLTAYRVVQEALTNVQKHVGGGAHARVRIVKRPGALEVTVTDDGRGDGSGIDGSRAGAGRSDGGRSDGGRADAGHGAGGVPGGPENSPEAGPESGPLPASDRAMRATGAYGAAAREAAHGAPADPPGPWARSAGFAEPGGGHGLMGMRERAAALHGECETGPLPEGGFRVHVWLPVQRHGGDGKPRAEEEASA